MADEVPPKSPYTDGTPGQRPAMTPSLLWHDVGSSGLRQYGGWVREEFLRALQGREAARVYREMRDNDATVGALLFVIQQSMRKIDWNVKTASNKPEAAKAAEFVESLRTDMSHSWDEFIIEALSCLEFGFSPHEIVWKKRNGYKKNAAYSTDGKALPNQDNPQDVASSKYDDGLIGIRRLPLRGQETILRWYFDGNGSITGMQQQPWMGPLIDLPIEKLLIFRPHQYKNNPEGRSILRNSYRCFSEDTEILAEEGWKLLKDVELTERVATLNTKTYELEYQYPTKRYANYYQGKMFHQDGKKIDQLVTPNHRMYVRRDGSVNWDFVEAADLKKSIFFKLDAVWNGEEQEFFTLPEFRRTKRIRDGFDTYNGETELIWKERKIPMDAWLSFFGIWLAEGHTYKTPKGQRIVGISQNVGEACDDIFEWISDCGFAAYQHKGDGKRVVLEIFDAQLYEYLQQFGKSYDKYIPLELKKLCPRQLDILFWAMWIGDGGWSGYKTTRTYATVSDKLANDVSEILFKMGYAPIVRKQKTAGWSEKGIWIISLAKARMGGNRANLLEDRREWLDYDGTVYCLEVPNSTLFVRRNGKASWSGNSYFFTKRIQEEEAILFERMNGLPELRVPNSLLEAAQANDVFAQQALQTYKQMITNIRIDEQMGLILPSDTWPGVNGPSSVPMFEFKLVSPQGNALRVDSNITLKRYSLDILKTVLADFIDLGHQARGTQNLAISKVDLFFQAVEGWLNGIASVLNRYLLPRIWQLNGWSFDTMPEFAPDLVQRLDLDMLSNFVLRLSQAGLMLFPDLELENWLRNAAGMPETDEPSMIQPDVIQDTTGQQKGQNTPEDVAKWILRESNRRSLINQRPYELQAA